MNKGLIKKLAIYFVKVIVLFLILYFTFVEPTGLVLIAYVSMPLYIGVYLLLLLILSKFPKSDSLNKNFVVRHLLQPILLVLGIGIMFLLVSTIKDINNVNKQNNVKTIINKADDVLEYNLSSIYSPSPNELQYQHNTIFIDYDEMTVSFLLVANYHEFHTFKLSKDNKCNNINNKQIDYTIPSSENTLITFYPIEENNHRTSAIQLMMKDGTVYSVCDLKEEDTGYYYYLGLKWGADIKEFNK